MWIFYQQNANDSSPSRIKTRADKGVGETDTTLITFKTLRYNHNHADFEVLQGQLDSNTYNLC